MAISIVSVTPASGASGVLIQSTVEVVLDRPIDPSTIGSGTFFVEGAGKEVFSGPYLPINHPGAQQPTGILNNPAYNALVNGTYTCEYIDATTLLPLASTFVDDGSGSVPNYYTRIKFQPKPPLVPSTEYTVYLSGEVAVNQHVGISERTVFDVVPNVANAGTAKVFNSGLYNDTVNATFEIRIVKAGDIGAAKYQWRKGAGSWSPDILTHNFKRVLSDGVSVSFDLENTYALNDSFTFLAKPAAYLQGVQTSKFTTGEFGIQKLDLNDCNLVSNAAPPFSGGTTSAVAIFDVDRTNPMNLRCDVDDNYPLYEFYFTENLNPVIDVSGIEIHIGPANGDPCVRSSVTYTPNALDVNVDPGNNKLLKVLIDAAHLPLGKNTRIEITIQPWAVVAASGAKLNYPASGLWFTEFDPLYSHPYALEVIAGNIVADLPTSIMKLAIFEISRYVDATIVGDCLDPHTSDYLKQIRWRYVSLKAVQAIIGETQGLYAATKKVLGDFEIEFDTKDSVNNLLPRIIAELKELEPVLRSGGCQGLGTSVRPGFSVKGACDPYRPLVGRTWYEPLAGEPGVVTGKYSPHWDRGPYAGPRHRNATYSLTRRNRGRR